MLLARRLVRPKVGLGVGEEGVCDGDAHDAIKRGVKVEILRCDTIVLNIALCVQIGPYI